MFVPIDTRYRNKLHHRTYSIDVIKLLFSVLIAYHHLAGPFNYANNIVMIFFILSGYYLIQNFDSGRTTNSPWDFTIARLRKLYPHYLFSLCMLILIIFLRKWFLTLHSLKEITVAIGSRLPELLLLQSIGIFPGGGINYPCWQLSVLIFSSHILHALLIVNRTFTVEVFSPLVAIAYFVYGSSKSLDLWGTKDDLICVPVFRAFGGLCLGLFVYQPITLLSQRLKSWNSTHPQFCFWITSAVSIFLIDVIYYLHQSTISILAFLLILSIENSQIGLLSFLFNRRVFCAAGNLSTAIYLDHALIIHIFKLSPINSEGKSLRICIIFTIFILTYSLASTKILQHITPK